MSREPALAGQTVVVLGGSAGIGLETARHARANGADLILTARNPDRLHEVGRELEAKIAAFDVTDFDRLQRFFDEVPGPVDHVLVTGPGPYYAPLQEFDVDEARRDIDAQLFLSASLLGDQLDERRERLRATLPIRRVVGPADVAALAVHLMTNTAVTGATFDIDGGQQLVEQ